MTITDKRDFMSILSSLATETRNKNSMHVDTATTAEMVRIINNEDKSVAIAVESILDDIAMAVDSIHKRMYKGGRLLYFGAGTSGRLGILDASECPPTYNTDPNLVVAVMAGGDAAIRHAQENVEDSVEQGKKDCSELDITPLDTVVGIAASGRTPYVVGAVEYAKEKGALTIAVSTNSKSVLNDYVDHYLAPEVGPEVITGSTRMKSGTAQKLVLNMLTTCAMIKLGKTYSNLMVDFRPTNEKLRGRAPKIIMETTGATFEEAEIALEKANGEVKVAILCIMTKQTPEFCSKLLENNENVLAKAINAFKLTETETKTAENSMNREATPVFVVADGGGTKTLVIVTKENGEELGRSTVGSTNCSSVSIDSIANRLEGAIEEASNGMQNIKIQRMWIGLAGIGDPIKREALRKKIDHLSENIIITPDINLIASAIPKSTQDCLSISVIAGTGSVALAERMDGTMDISGGWGPVLGDQGSGFMLGNRCIKAVSLDMEKSGPSTLMTKAVCEKWNANSRLEFVRFIQSIPLDQQRREIASLAKIVLDCAFEMNDKVALEIAQSEAISLSNFVVSLVKRNNAKSANVAVTGSVIVKCDKYREIFMNNIESQNIKLEKLVPVESPAVEASKYLFNNP